MTQAGSAWFAPERRHRLFLAAAIALGVGGGFSLAIAISADAALGFHWGARWAAAAQVHGHLQTVGFAGLFVLGMGLRLAPRFSREPLHHARLAPLVLALVLLGVIARSVGQPFADRDALAALAEAGAALEALGALAFAAMIGPTILPALRRREPEPAFFAVGTVAFVAQALLGAVWVADAVRDDRVALPADRTAVLIHLQIYGFLLFFLLGVAVRAFPQFFGQGHADRRWPGVAWRLTLAGATAMLVARLWPVVADERVWEIEAAGALALAVGLLVVAWGTRWWRPATGLREGVRPIARAVQAAMAWLTIAAAVLAVSAVEAGLTDEPIAALRLDAVRHTLAIGVITMLIVGMAQLVLPEFAMERVAVVTRRWRGWGPALLLSAAAAMRAAPGIYRDTLPSEADYWHMVSAGVLGLLVIATLGVLFLRVWQRGEEFALITVTRAQQARSEPRP